MSKLFKKSSDVVSVLLKPVVCPRWLMAPYGGIGGPQGLNIPFYTKTLHKQLYYLILWKHINMGSIVVQGKGHFKFKDSSRLYPCKFSQWLCCFCGVQCLCEICGVHSWINKLIICKQLPRQFALPQCMIRYVCLSVVELSWFAQFLK